MPRHASTHAAGVVITRDEVSSYVPLAKNGDQTVTQFTMTEIEQLGLLKMDFLGLRTLTVISDAVKYVKETDSKIVAKDIYEYFPELSLNDLTIMIERYKTAGAWADSTEITKKEFNHIQDIMISAGELDKKAPYDKLVYKGK